MKFSAIAGVGINEADRTIIALVLDEAGEKHELQFTEGMAGGMLLGLTDQLRVLQEDERNAAATSGQLTALTDVRGFSVPDGRRGLALTFEHAMRVMSLLTPDMRRHLRRELETLERLSIAEPNSVPKPN